MNLCYTNLRGGSFPAILTVLLSLFPALGVSFAQGKQAFLWQQPQAKVLPTGDIEYAPKPFVYKPGRSIRYIDYEKGSDTNSGSSKERPWKHHPWDPLASGKARECRGVRTYVFKGGVNYRGTLVVRDSGTDTEPIQLTRDPSWGDGPTIICGSELIGGWKKGDPGVVDDVDAMLGEINRKLVRTDYHKDIPHKDKVWYVDLNFAPRCLWCIDRTGKVQRVPLARTPNWTVKTFDDVKSEWWSWTHAMPVLNQTKAKTAHLGIDKIHINGEPGYFKDAIIWPEYGWVMGNPYPTRVDKVNMRRHGLQFAGWVGKGSGVITNYMRYYLEDKPHYLDDPDGEFWFDKEAHANKGRLYLRPPKDVDPNKLRIEAARYLNLIDAENLTGIEISGLTFRFTNVYWDLTAMPFVNPDVDPACIRLRGSGDHITIRNCTFEHVNMPIRIKAIQPEDRIDNVLICDNRIRYTDHGGMYLEDGGRWGLANPHIGRLYDLKILRNQLDMTGMRNTRFGKAEAIAVYSAETCEIAGNVLDHGYGLGITVTGAKRNASTADRPLSRVLIHHNKVINPLLNINDYGGIETWQGGPMYVYNNVSGNPGGYTRWKIKRVPKQPGASRFGHAYYLDGAFKNYHFNNIAWGKSSDPLSPLGNTAAFQEIHSYQNTFFNNTVYNFVVGSRRQAPQAGRDMFLANIWDTIGYRVFRHSDATQNDANAADAGREAGRFAYETNAYEKNVFYNVGEYGIYDAKGILHKNLSDFQQGLLKHHSLASGVGIETTTDPLRNPPKHDFRLSEKSAAIDQGVKVFVPWSLYAVVGEWGFYPAGNDPTRIIDEHWYMTPYYIQRADYHRVPMFPLRGVNVSLSDYVHGTLEDWTKGALQLNGRDQYAVLPNSSMRVEPDVGKLFTKESFDWVTVDAPDAMTPGTASNIKLTLTGVPDGQMLSVALHWSGGGKWGINCGTQPQKVKGPGPYTFTMMPVEKGGLERFEIIIFAGPNTNWRSRTHLARQKIAVRRMMGDRDGNLEAPQISKGNFLIEMVMKAESGWKDAILVAKQNDSGYSLRLNAKGQLHFSVVGDDKQAFSVTADRRVNDGKWHHVIAECNRQTRILTLYLDGKLDATAGGPRPGVSLANASDLFVGGTPEGKCLKGCLDFLRIAKGTLQDAKTSIEELYAWQFNGPFLRDFTGMPPKGRARDAGALEAE